MCGVEVPANSVVAAMGSGGEHVRIVLPSGLKLVGFYPPVEKVNELRAALAAGESVVLPVTLERNEFNGAVSIQGRWVHD